MTSGPYLDGPICRIPLPSGAEAICDAADLDIVSRYRWSIPRGGYPETKTRINGRRVTLRLHRLLCPPPPDGETDHRDADRLNARRSNLRPCTKAENRRNVPNRRDGFKGVKKRGNRWHARIKVNETDRHLGTFATEVDAARAYDVAARAFFGEFARTNFNDSTDSTCESDSGA